MMRVLLDFIMIISVMNIVGCTSVSGNVYSNSSNVSASQLNEIDEQGQQGEMRNIK